MGAWRTWLSSLATDADAANAAAHLYAELAPEQRDAWLEVLAEDLRGLPVPKAAVYGPLLAVESDPARYQRIQRQSGVALDPSANVRRAYVASTEDQQRVAVLICSLYLDFVAVLACQYSGNKGFSWVKQLPLLGDDDAPKAGDRFARVTLAPAAIGDVIDELAHAVVAHRRSARPLPDVLCDWAELFRPGPGEWNTNSG